SRKLSSDSVSIRVIVTSRCASASARHRPTGPAPTTITPLAAMSATESGRLLRRHHVLHSASPAGVGEIEYEAGWRLVLRLIVGLWRSRASGEIFAAGVHHFFLSLIEIVDPHAEVVEAELLL